MMDPEEEETRGMGLEMREAVEDAPGCTCGCLGDMSCRMG